MKSLTHLAIFCLISLTASMVSAQNVGIGTLSPDSTLSIKNKLVIGGAQGDLVFTDDEGSIIFPATSAPNSPMIHMFKTGSLNADRMVLAHSPSFSNWGLQYNDVGDKFQFLGGGLNAMTVDLTNRRVGIGTDSPTTSLHIESGSEASLSTHGFLQIGSTTALNLVMDDNEIAARNNGVAAPLFLQPNQGNVLIGTPSSSFTEKLFVEAEAGIDPLRVRTANTSRLLIYENGDYLMFPERMRIRGTFSNDHLVAIGGNVQIQSGQEASLTEHGYLQTGSTTGINLVMDNNEIAARNNGAESPLYLQPNQGNVVIGGTGGFTEKLVVEGTSGTYALRIRTQGSTRMVVDSVGAVIIGSYSNKKPGYELNVDGQIVAEEVLVQNSVNWPDYVFATDYALPQLTDVESFIAQNRHLPDVPSAAQIESDGINLGEMDKTLLRKIEELTLYVIGQSKDIAQLKQENSALKAALQELQK